MERLNTRTRKNFRAYKLAGFRFGNPPGHWIILMSKIISTVGL